MPRVLFFAVILAACLLAQPPGRFSRRSMFPPEITLDRYIDVVKVAPQSFSVETDSAQFRVLRAKLAANASVPLHDQRSGLIVALTAVNLRFTTPDKKFRDVRLSPGQTQWSEGDTISEQNLSGDACEFLFIETAPPQA